MLTRKLTVALSLSLETRRPVRSVSDGHVDPYSLTMAYAKGARTGGVRIVEGATVTGFRQANGRITHVVTDQGAVACEIAVNAAGLWARHAGAMAGIELPVAVLQHQYLVTEKSSAVYL